jgi:folate-binding Fe-S cluster repair protein YgfZ
MSTSQGIDLSSSTDGLGVLAFRGPDAARFLQGQLSAEVEKLGVGASTLAGLHSPQGRTVAVLALLRATPEDVFAVLPSMMGSANDAAAMSGSVEVHACYVAARRTRRTR